MVRRGATVQVITNIDARGAGPREVDMIRAEMASDRASMAVRIDAALKGYDRQLPARMADINRRMG
jgi:hypothetical protein